MYLFIIYLRVSLCILSWPGTYHTNQAGLELQRFTCLFLQCALLYPTILKTFETLLGLLVQFRSWQPQLIDINSKGHLKGSNKMAVTKMPTIVLCFSRMTLYL